MNTEEVSQYIEDMPNEVLEKFQFSMPWQFDPEDGGRKDPDGFTPERATVKDEIGAVREILQEECWDKFHKNPQINTSVRGTMGRLAGWGFETTSEILEIQEAIEQVEEDPRNRLYTYMPKYVGRFNVEGELFLPLTAHTDGFVEVDFYDPASVTGGEDNNGIIFHPKKTNMPLFYLIGTGADAEQIPSIFIARYPELIEVAAADKDYDRSKQQGSRSRKAIYKKFGGYRRFIVSIDKGLITTRAIAYLRTTIEWLNHYENLKKYEIDHKKSSGAYVWVVKITDARAFKTWMKMSDADREKTGIMVKKTPGSTLVLPPGMEIQAISPQLTSISEQDTDILHMATSGLNEPEDVTTGQAKGTYASIKASRGPMSDRISDEIAYWHRFLIHDFWGGIFFLKASMGKFPFSFKVREAYKWDKNQKAVFKERAYRPEKLIDVSYPVSEMIDFEARAKGLLGVKHGNVSDNLGIPHSEVARRIGFSGYGRLRLKSATEEERYPKLVLGIDQESLQEQAEAEPKRPTPKKPANTEE